GPQARNCLKLSGYHSPAAVDLSAHLLRHAIRGLGARVAKARPASAGALAFRVTALRAPTQTGVAVRRGRNCSRGLLVTVCRGGLCLRQAHWSSRRRGESRQPYRDKDAQYKTHDETSL